MYDSRRFLLAAALTLAGLGGVSSEARAADSASLQFTIPAPNPVQAGDRLLIQALAINTGAAAWAGGSYYWVAEVYDLDQNLIARTNEVAPRSAVAAGGVASVEIVFPVPETVVGRLLYRVFLVKDSQTLIESEYRPFQVLFRPIPPPPEVVDYRVEGNVTVSYKNSSRNKWSNHQGATTFNAVGKIKESSYLVNAYILHEVGDIFDPFIVLFTYYAPWGTIYGGDISPTFSEMSINGQGLRGAMLEQRKGNFEWSLVGGQTVTSQAGNATTNGRFARVLYGLKGARTFRGNQKLTLSYFLSQDEPGSLGTDPNEANFRGPTLVAEKNSGIGVAYEITPAKKLKILLDLQRNSYTAGTTAPAVNDTAWKGEVRWSRKLFRWKSSLQRAGSNFVAFGAPSVVGDRQTFNTNFTLYPARWYTASLGANQYTDNLEGDSSRTTTTQRLISTSHGFQFRNGLSWNISGSLNSASGKPRTALDNQTTIFGTGLSKTFGRHSASLSAQVSQFRDKNKLAHDLDTQTFAVSTSFSLPNSAATSFGITRSGTKDKIDGSARTTMSISPSYSKRLKRNMVGQVWGTMAQGKNTSPTSPSDVTSTTLNAETTWAKTKQMNLTFGLGYNSVKDKVTTANTVNEILFNTRVSYSF
jgi:hypothetical protein